MSGISTRNVAVRGFARIQLDPRIEVIPHGVEVNSAALRLYADRADKEWSLTDCLSFVVMEQRGIRDALSGDAHFDQAGFRSVLTGRPPE